MLRLVFLTALFCLPTLAVAQGPAKKPDVPKKEDAKKEDGLPLGVFKLRSVGPAVTSGRIVGLAVHPTERSTFYVAVACGGVWKTTNGGTTWIPIFDNEGSFSIGCVVLDPKNPNTVWVGTGENNSQRSVGYGDGIYKSIDGGRSWKNVGLKQSEHIAKIVVDPKDSDNVIVAAQGPLWGPGGDRGLYKTTDGGTTWVKLLGINDDTGITDFVVDPLDSKIIVAAAYQRRRHVWTLVNGGPGSGVHRTTDGGKTWAKIGGGLPGGDLGRIGLANTPLDADLIYAIIEAGDKAGGIFKSGDKGITWVKQNPFDQQAQYYSHLVVDAHAKDRLYVMSVLLQVSDDAGKTVRALGEKFKHVDNHCIWVDPTDPKHYLVGCDGGIYESKDRGQNWHFLSNLPVTQFYDINVDQNPASGPFYHIYGGTQDNFTLGGPIRTRSVHGITNADWYVTQGGDGFHCAVDPTDPNTIYSEYQYGGLCRFDRKTGNRVDIQPQAKPGEKPLRWNWDAPMILSPHDPKRLYFAANILFRSDDRGDNWTPVSEDLTRGLDRDKLPVFGKIQSPEAVSKHVSTSFYGNITALAESPKKAGVIYVGTDDGLIQTTTDGGKTWTKIDTFPGVPEKTYVSELLASQHDVDVVYAAFDNHKMADFKPYLLKSVDGGKTWATAAGNLPERGGVYALAEDHVNSALLFAGTEFGLFVSIDGGKAWQRMKGGLPTIQVKDLVIQRHNNDLVVGTFGRGFYAIDDYSALRNLTKETLAGPAALFAPKSAMVYVPNAQYGGGGKAFQGSSLYTADNPTYGIAFTVHIKDAIKTKKQLRKDAEKEAIKEKKDIPYPKLDDLRAEAEEESASYAIVIRDNLGTMVRMLSASDGVNKVVWDFKAVSVNATDEFAGNGPLCVPGSYTATVVKREGGKTAPLTEPIRFALTPDPLSALTAGDYVEIAAFNRETGKLQRSLYEIAKLHTELTTKLEAVKVALELTAKSDDAAKIKVRELLESLKLMKRNLNGDAILAGRNENVPASIADRVRHAAGATDDAWAKPTGTQRRVAGEAAGELAPMLKTLKDMRKTDLTALEAKVEELNGR